jgi:glutathione synthase/RimK-type ligase-like ATP-grasp enzyme
MAPLRPVGIEVVTRSWTDAAGFEDFDAVTPLLAWGYHTRESAWRGLLDRLDAAGVTAINPVETLAWNTQKTYLAELEEAGAPIVPTLFVDRLTPAALAEAYERFGHDLIVKPQVSGGSFGTIRLPPGANPAGGPTGPVMLQPFLPAVAQEGELSLLYFDGAFSHAIAKVAGAGDFRVQYQYGGAYHAIEATDEMRAAADAVLAAAGRPPSYARIDLIRDGDGVLRLMELEAIEPDLYLDLAPDGGAGFAKAMVAAMG